MNIGSSYFLAIFLKNGKIVHKTTVTSVFQNEVLALKEAKEYAKLNNISYDDVDVTYTHEEQF